MKYTARVILFTTLILGLTQALIAQTQESASTQSLLAEVHQLRLAVERMISTMPRMQVTMQRMQLQEQRVAELSRQLYEARSQAASAKANQLREPPAIQDLERRLRDEQDQIRRNEITREIADRKNNMERNAQFAEQRSVQEAELAGMLRLEQGKLDDLSERLNALDRALDGK